MKKFLIAILAGVLMLTAAMPAFAKKHHHHKEHKHHEHAQRAERAPREHASARERRARREQSAPSKHHWYSRKHKQ